MRTRLLRGKHLTALVALGLAPLVAGAGSTVLADGTAPASASVAGDSAGDPVAWSVGAATFPSLRRSQGLTPNPVPQQYEPQTTLIAKADANRKIRIDSAHGSLVVTPSSLTDHDLPAAALAAYRHAAATMATQDPSCHLPWTLLAGIGRVESNHGRYGGSVLGTDGISRPAIIGIPLDGKGPVAAIHDTDHGRWDGDTVWDRAVGPMQFIPSTWATAGRDGDGDGVKNPNDINDAALAAGAYLCSGSGDLRGDAAMKAAIFRYNPSDYYVALVQAFERGYRTGAFVMPSPPPPPGGGTAPATHHPTAHGTKHAQPTGKGTPKPSAGSSGGASHGTTSPTPKPSGSPKPTPKPTPSPAPTPKPTPKPSPSPSPSGPTLVPLSGTLTACGGGWCVGSTALDLGAADQLAATAAHDYDGDGATETNTAELQGLTGKPVDLQVENTPSGAVVYVIGGADYRLADGSFTR